MDWSQERYMAAQAGDLNQQSTTNTGQMCAYGNPTPPAASWLSAGTGPLQRGLAGGVGNQHLHTQMKMRNLLVLHERCVPALNSPFHQM